MNKIFGIGFHRTGTTTLRRVFKTLGFSCCGWRPDLVEAIRQKNFAPVSQLVDQFDSCQDNPWPLIYQELDQHYPNSKFILTVRDSERWIRSMVNYFDRETTPMREWIYGNGKGCPRGNEALYLARYEKHNEEVLAYFQDRPDDLLVVNWEKGDGWEKVCAFLGKDIPNVPLPHVNRSLRRATRLWRKLTRIVRGQPQTRRLAGSERGGSEGL